MTTVMVTQAMGFDQPDQDYSYDSYDQEKEFLPYGSYNNRDSYEATVDGKIRDPETWTTYDQTDILPSGGRWEPKYEDDPSLGIYVR